MLLPREGATSGILSVFLPCPAEVNFDQVEESRMKVGDKMMDLIWGMSCGYTRNMAASSGGH